MPLHAFERRLAVVCRRSGLLPARSSVLAAVSGGPDSMAMLYALSALSRRPPGFTLVVAHLDHGLRGERGAADAIFVADAARRLGVAAVVERIGVRRRRGGSVEAAAREVRYEFLGRTARRTGSDRIAVGHTADDQAETVLHRLCRGSGLRGAAAMRASRPLAPGGDLTLIRPLLGETRSAVRTYLRDTGIPWRVDETNLEAAWTRNRIRGRVLPMLDGEVHRGAAAALARFATMAADAWDLVSQLADKAEKEALVPGRGEGDWRVRGTVAAALPAAVRSELWRRVLRRLGVSSPAAADVGAVEDVRAGRRRAVSLRGGAVVARRAGDDVRLVARPPAVRLRTPL